jgi:hypothetical protein
MGAYVAIFTECNNTSNICYVITIGYKAITVFLLMDQPALWESKI